jgi:hypothetical protein
MSLNRCLQAALAALTLSVVFVADASAEGPVVRTGLFQNYYVNPPVTGEGIGAEMYPSPHPVPAWVGGSYYTYRGLYPHEHMYPHMKTYRRGKGPLGLVPVNTTRILYW